MNINMHPSSSITIVMISFSFIMLMENTTMANPRTELVRLTCNANPNPYNYTIFIPNFIATMNKIFKQLQTTGFGEAVTGTGVDTSYALAQCFGDLSVADCSTCFSKLRILLPSCLTNTSNRAYLDGCFIRVERYNFFAEYAAPGDGAAVCGSAKRENFEDSVKKAVEKAAEAAPGNDRRYARAEVEGEQAKAHVLANCWRTLNASACRACLKNASASVLRCLPSSEGRAMNAACFMRYSDINFLNAELPEGSSKGDYFDCIVFGFAKCSIKCLNEFGLLTLNCNDLGSLANAGITVVFIIVAIVSSLIVMAAGAAIAVYFRNHRIIQKKRNGSNDVKKLVRVLSHSGLYFRLSTLDKATKSFSEENKLGGGGSGTVYKGVLVDGREVAVKKLFFNNLQRAADFYNEVNIISCMEHKNLVRLLGCNCSGSESLLVYEYMPNQGLDDFIFDPEKGKLLNWEKRYNILIGIAEGLAYLHDETSVKIIHRDIKASNILLDSKFFAKIADFGLARPFQEDNSHVSTCIAGTLGYMAPEYVIHGRLTEKADIYSFGVLLLETATGRQNNGPDPSAVSYDLVITVWRHFNQGTLEELIDPNVLVQGNKDGNKSIKREVSRVMHIGLLCVQETPILRPAMHIVLEMFKGDRELLFPTSPPFINQRMMEMSGISEDLRSSASSSRAVSKSSFFPR